MRWRNKKRSTVHADWTVALGSVDDFMMALRKLSSVLPQLKWSCLKSVQRGFNLVGVASGVLIRPYASCTARWSWLLSNFTAVEFTAFEVEKSRLLVKCSAESPSPIPSGLPLLGVLSSVLLAACGLTEPRGVPLSKATLSLIGSELCLHFGLVISCSLEDQV